MAKPKERKKTVDWEITRSCNYDCSYCFWRDKEKTNNILLKNYQNIIEVFKKLKDSYEIIITGGEPFIISNFITIIESIVKETDHTLGIVTNLLREDYPGSDVIP